ncbi:hypothetical protein FWK35_00011928 [Aphis craccivora]|uniref:Uncharacterized protein n=1 Tax=Aphis craccivora TaxID=307492 RepID=A0A6G0Z0R8_APHCR|nr:hypothetical protein FWK35_00011928 [Aphis craccivora]
MMLRVFSIETDFVENWFYVKIPVFS